MSIQIIVILDLDNALITLSLKVRSILLKMYVDLIIDLIILELTSILVFSII